MKKYVLILILLISCVRNQSKKISNDEGINIAKIDSTEIEGKILHPTSSKKQSAPKHNIRLEKEKPSDSFIVNSPFSYNGKKHNIQLTCERSQSNSVMITKVTSDLLLPKNFHTILEDDFSLRNFYFPDNYDTAYKEYAANKFIGDWLVTYKKDHFRNFPAHLLYIVDVDHDGYDDMLLLDLQNSMRDNNVYVMFKGSKNRISYKEKFFNKVAFYGWDKTGKYLITGVSDTRERKLYKNKIVQGKLKTVDQCTEYAVSDKSCWR